MLVGLQGSGKTTHAGKLALRFKEQGRRCLLVAADVYRPAAIEQLQTLGKQIDLPVYVEKLARSRRHRASRRRRGAAAGHSDGADRYGRPLADRRRAHGRTRAHQSGDAPDRDPVRRRRDDRPRSDGASPKVSTSGSGITGIILTKMDGDARGGAALSIYRITGAPIKFVGVGEKLSALEPFHPDRLASRILGMGDVMSLIERTQSVYSLEQAKELEAKFRKNEFTLDDFLGQLRQVRKMGSMTDLMKMIPGMSKLVPQGVRDRRARRQPHRSDHLLDESPGTAPSRNSQRVAPPPHRARQRNARRRHQPAGQAVRTVAYDDEATRRRQTSADSGTARAAVAASQQKATYLW